MPFTIKYLAYYSKASNFGCCVKEHASLQLWLIILLFFHTQSLQLLTVLISCEDPKSLMFH